MNRHSGRRHRPGPQGILVLVLIGCLLAGCVSTGPDTSPDDKASATAVSNHAKRVFLLRLIGFCADVNLRVAAEAAKAGGDKPSPAGMADLTAEQLERMIGRAAVEGAPAQDRKKYEAFMAAISELIRRKHAEAEALGTGASPDTDAKAAKAASEASKAAYGAADTAGMAYGMPHLDKCQDVASGAATWRPMRSSPIGVQQAGTAVVGGTVWVIGGLASGKAIDSVMTYDPVLNDWRIRQTPLRTPVHHPMAVSYQNTPVVIGGFVGSPDGDVAVDTVYRLVDGKWVPMPPLHHARAAGAAAVVGDSIVVVGGRDSEEQLITKTEIFDGTAWQDAEAPPVPGDHLAAVGGGTAMYVVGGRKIHPERSTGALQRFDLKDGHWTLLKDMPTPRSGLGAALVDGRIFAVGGESANSALDTVEAYDIADHTWSAQYPRLKAPRHGLAVAAVGERLLAIDGSPEQGHTGFTTAVEQLDVGTGSPADLTTAATATGTGTATATGTGTATATGAGAAATAAMRCPRAADAALRACLTSAKVRGGRLAIGYTTSFVPTTRQGPTDHHLHFFTANLTRSGGITPDPSAVQATADPKKIGSWFNVYDRRTRYIDDRTERGGKKRPLDVKEYALLCVRVVAGTHRLVPDRRGGSDTGNCVRIAR